MNQRPPDPRPARRLERGAAESEAWTRGHMCSCRYTMPALRTHYVSTSRRFGPRLHLLPDGLTHTSAVLHNVRNEFWTSVWDLSRAAYPNSLNDSGSRLTDENLGTPSNARFRGQRVRCRRIRGALGKLGFQRSAAARMRERAGARKQEGPRGHFPGDARPSGVLRSPYTRWHRDCRTASAASRISREGRPRVSQPGRSNLKDTWAVAETSQLV